MPLSRRLVNAAAEMGWSAPAKIQASYAGHGEPPPDLSIRLPSREILITVRELDERGRPGRAFVTHTDYLPHAERTTANNNFTDSGRLEVTLTQGWEQRPVLSQRDSGRSTLEGQLPALIRVLEISKAEAEWLSAELDRREATAAMRAYANKIDTPAAALEAPAKQAAREWAAWIREHARRPRAATPRRGTRTPAGMPWPGTWSGSSAIPGRCWRRTRPGS